MCSFAISAKAEPLFLMPIIQGYEVDEIVPAVRNGNDYIDIEALANVLQMRLDVAADNSTVTSMFLGQEHVLRVADIDSSLYKIVSGRIYLAKNLYEDIFPITLRVDYFHMSLEIDSDVELPPLSRIKSQQRRSSFVPFRELDSFENYQFDERLWASSIVDFSYRKAYSIRDYQRDDEKTYQSNYYQLNLGTLFAGMDTHMSVFGDNHNDHYDPRARFLVGRTFLEEPKNAVNLTEMKMGDVTGYDSTLFKNTASGRGVFLSSFKDLVMSADKTININGPISDGWDVELYLGEQLIGFRQSSINGRYEFANIPVHYGLNDFKLVFYGPYGEMRTESRRYYSGTSPVQKGEFGYTVNAYQEDRYLVEDHEPFVNPSNKAVYDFTGYYGITDHMTLITGLTQTPEEITDDRQDFGNMGLQLIFDGASFQYNTLYNFTDNKVGHHFEVQGDVHIGDIFLRHEYYGDMKSPISYYNGKYLKDLSEVRLTGIVPWSNLPYFISYQENNDHESQKNQEVRFRLSPNFRGLYSLSVENLWINPSRGQNTNELHFLLHAQRGRLGLRAHSRYRTSPNAYLSNVGAQVDYRWDRYTYLYFNWDHDRRSEYSLNSNVDRFTITAGRVFSIGGLSLGLGYDTDKDVSVSANYNISFGKVPEKTDVFTSGYAQMSRRASLYARVLDENDEPVPGVKIMVTGFQDPFVANDNGEVLITDMEPYQKTILSIDPLSADDIALVPEFEEKKLVLRPGTVLPVKIPFVRKGGVEGAIEVQGNPHDYKIALLDSAGKTIMTKTPERDGAFIFDELIFGKYDVIIMDKENNILHEKEIIIDKVFISISEPILV